MTRVDCGKLHGMHVLLQEVVITDIISKGLNQFSNQFLYKVSTVWRDGRLFVRSSTIQDTPWTVVWVR
jgi:hypothetical protein